MMGLICLPISRSRAARGDGSPYRRRRGEVSSPRITGSKSGGRVLPGAAAMLPIIDGVEFGGGDRRRSITRQYAERDADELAYTAPRCRDDVTLMRRGVDSRRARLADAAAAV